MAACVLLLERTEASVRAVLCALPLEPLLQKLRLCVGGFIKDRSDVDAVFTVTKEVLNVREE